jgi:hypothetical protein
MTINPISLLERLIQKGSETVDLNDGGVDRETLDALEWSDTDSGKDLKDRSEKLRLKAQAHV